MKKKSFKYHILSTVPYLQRIPFLWILQIYYFIALKCIILCLEKIPQIQAVYLSGSGARNKILYGLSDIDFKIFLKGKKDTALTNRIQHIFTSLKPIFPVLGPPDEKGIYFLDDLQEDYKNFSFIQHLFDERFYKHKLLWGKDIIKNISPPPSKKEKKISYIWKCRYWMEKLITAHTNDSVHPVIKRYHFFKAIADISFIYLILQNSKQKFESREKSLILVKNFLNPKDALAIDNLLQERNHYFQHKNIPFEETFLLFKRILQKCLLTIEDSLPPQTIHLPFHKDLYRENKILSQKYSQKIKNLCTHPVTVSILPSLYIGTHPLDCSYFDKSIIIISASYPLSLTEITKIKLFYHKHLKNKALIYIKENDQYLYSIDSFFMEHWILSQPTDQFQFILLAQNFSSPLKEEYINVLEKKLLSSFAELEKILKDPTLYQLETLTYFQIFFSSLQNFILYFGLKDNRFDFLPTSKDIIQHLKDNTPLSHPFLDLLYNNYQNLILKKTCYPERIFQKSKSLLTAFLDLIKTRKNIKDITSFDHIPNENTISISIVIITKNHAQQLKRCLHSLLKLKRQPKEIIVVDNASTDSTKDITHDFRAPFPIKYIYEERTGIGIVRNTGIETASSDIIAFTDDDIIVHPEWLSSIEKPFLKDPLIGIVGGTVYADNFDRKDIVTQYFNILKRA